MNSFFAAGLFDSPWILVAIVIGSAVANWLSKRREQKQADQRPEGDESSPSSDGSQREFKLEEAMRRLMGEEPPAPKPSPPPLPRAARGELPSVPAWREEEPLQPPRQAVPSLRPPPVPGARASVTATAVNEQQRRAARRFEQLSEQGRHPATVVGRGRRYRSPAGKRSTSPWRNPRSARQAFVASLVFAPPKGLET